MSHACCGARDSDNAIAHRRMLGMNDDGAEADNYGGGNVYHDAVVLTLLRAVVMRTSVAMHVGDARFAPMYHSCE